MNKQVHEYTTSHTIQYSTVPGFFVSLFPCVNVPGGTIEQ